MGIRERIPFFSREGKHSREAKTKLKRILFRIAMPKGISLEEKIMVESLVDDIITARMETQITLLEEFQRRVQNAVVETLKEENECYKEGIEKSLREITIEEKRLLSLRLNSIEKRLREQEQRTDFSERKLR